MPEWKPVGSPDMLADGQMKEVEVGEATLLVARVGGRYFATDGRCTHLGGRLARGKLDGLFVICPLHKSKFDLRDGHNVEWIPKIPGIARTLAAAIKKPADLHSYPTRIQDNQVWVEL